MRASLFAVVLVGCSKKDASAPVPAPTPVPSIAADAAASRSPVDAGAALVRDSTIVSAPDGAGRMADADHETINGFALGTPSEDVVKALGRPAKQSREETMAATGETVTTWSFHGLELTMSKAEGKYTVNAIGVKPPSTATTSRGIHLGSTRVEVEASYQQSKEDNGADAASLLVGSPFGGELFRFKDGKVSEIFLGAMAE